MPHRHGTKPRIRLSKTEIDLAIPLISEGLEKYVWIQANRFNRDLRDNLEFRTRFNQFYKVRRNQVWQNAFYELLESKKGVKLLFAETLEHLHRSCGRVEASFASKLVATLDPAMLVLDRFVLQNVGLRLPSISSKSRIELVNQAYVQLGVEVETFLKTENGQYLVQRFTERYPTKNVTPVKMVDLILWQSRPRRN